MEALFGITGKDFVLLAADKVVARSIMVMKATEDKSRDLSGHIAMVYSGENGDAVTFAEYIQRNVQYYGIKHEIGLSTAAAANFTRRELAQSLRSRKPYNVFTLIGGYSERDGPELYWLDYMASMQKIPFAAHGYASFFTMSTMDRHYKKDMNLEEAIELLKMCMEELKTRFIVNLKEYAIKVIDKDGVRDIKI
ncbi:hypothetical protein MIR68_003001 [Amoeboaphelidium protococcarum]|nr:hypothetical protein MIR68_011926 [Amoeboaphelidium protococcarum]KAI3638503.1 hypothetical protein MIR68_003001 [Amoeboaphelidium protococcarum]KAI3648120.1 hypothetical protein MP228_005974 [Amoeboaphelidium protococcarum]